MRASLSSSLNMNASPVWRPVYRALLTDGNWLERVAGAPRRLPLVSDPRRGLRLRVECRWPKVYSPGATPRLSAPGGLRWLDSRLLWRAPLCLRAPRLMTRMHGPNPGSADRAGPTSAPPRW